MLRPYQKTRKYKEFVRAYTRKYSLISRITGNNIYELELSSAIKFNKEGFRDVDRQVIKNNDVLRIVVMGDSFVEALQVDQGDTLTAVLEKSLNSVTKGEVMNFGVSNFGTTSEYWAYKTCIFANGDVIRGQQRTQAAICKM